MILSYLTVALLTQLSYSDDRLTDRYEQAGKVAFKAAYIQSGLESDILNIQKASETIARKWITDNGLNPVLTVGSAVVPVIFYKRIEFHSSGFTFKGTVEKKELNFNTSF